MPVIHILNVLTNIWLQINQGSISIPQLIRDYKDSIKEVNQYIEYNMRAVALAHEIQRDTEMLDRVEDKTQLQRQIERNSIELNRLRSTMSQNPAAEFFEAGFYQSHIDDLEDSALYDTNRISRYVNGKMEKVNPLLRGMAEISFLTQNTAWYRASQEILTRSDMWARVVDSKQRARADIRMANGERKLPQWWVDYKNQDRINKNYSNSQVLKGKDRDKFFEMAKEVRMQGVLDNYINYSLPNGRVEEYLNRMGFLMFTKYYKRVQSVVAKTTLSNPIKSSILVAAALAGLPTETLQEQSIMSRYLTGNSSRFLAGVIPVYSVPFHLENVLTPAIVKDEHLGGLF